MSKEETTYTKEHVEDMQVHVSNVVTELFKGISNLNNIVDGLKGVRLKFNVPNFDYDDRVFITGEYPNLGIEIQHKSSVFFHEIELDKDVLFNNEFENPIAAEFQHVKNVLEGIIKQTAEK